VRALKHCIWSELVKPDNRSDNKSDKPLEKVFLCVYMMYNVCMMYDV